MKRYIQSIKVNNVFHLRDFEISIADEKIPHLILTGKNGSGKTSLLNAVVELLDKVKGDIHKDFLKHKKWLESWKEQLGKNTDTSKTLSIEQSIKYHEEAIKDLFGTVELGFTDVDSLIRNYQEGRFIVAFYRADRKVEMSEPKNPTKPNLQKQWNAKDTATQEFLNFLSDLKVQEALARNEQLTEDADQISQWFIDFESLLKEVFQDEGLHLVFNYKDYSFKIESGEKSFKFTEMSDGFAAVLDIIVDLILKMQSKDSLTRAYEQEGIVLIDEIETHLHLELQKVVLPLLTKNFPNIQFIVTTHSPFVLNSLDTAVAFDLEQKEPITELTEYSYEALAEGYFGVRTSSSYMEMQLNRLKVLLQQDTLGIAERAEAKDLVVAFAKIPEPASPMIVGEYRQLSLKFVDKIKSLQGND